MVRRGWIVLGLGVLIVVAAVAARPRVVGPPERYYRWYAAPAGTARGWAMLLPGANGTNVFGDTTHYASVARRLNDCGFDALLVDYKPAYFASPDAPRVPTGEKIAWVARRAFESMARTHPEVRSRPGFLVGWSLGAEGVLPLVADEAATRDLRLAGAVMYYPANQERRKLACLVPVLVLTGEADDVVRVGDVRAMVDTRAPGSAAVELVTYPGAAHGFDIASLGKRRVVRMLPLIGPHATLQYEPKAARDASARMCDWLARTVGGR